MNFLSAPKNLWFVSFLCWVAAGITLVACSLFSLFDEPQGEVGIDEEVFSESSHRSFTLRKDLHEALESPLFHLSKIDRPMRLPDLRTHLLFYGSGGRPDRSLDSCVVQYGLRGVQGVYSTPSSEKVSLRFDSKSHKWSVSKVPTALQVQFVVHVDGAEVIVELKEDEGATITTPDELHRFSLNKSPMPPSVSASKEWAVGQWRAEPSLLERMGAVWYGRDLVIQTLGGEEYEDEAKRERVQFGTGVDAYVLWVGEGDCFIFDDDRWEKVIPGPESVDKILLRAKSVDHHSITFDLWNEDASSHTAVVLMRRAASLDTKLPPLRLVGALSKKRWIAEIQGKRVVLAPDDWIVLTSNGHTRIDSPERLDAYLQGELAGGLLAFSGIEKIQGESCLVGSFFNSSRSQRENVAISLYKSWERKESGPTRAESSDLDGDEDDDYFFDDEYDDDYDDDIEEV